jgi:hypothetical protein
MWTLRNLMMLPLVLSIRVPALLAHFVFGYLSKKSLFLHEWTSKVGIYLKK